MRAKIERDRSSGGEYLEVRLASSEHLDIGRLAWLASRAHRYLLAVGADVERSPHTLRYDVTGLESLHSFLRSYEITPLQYENMLVSVGEVLGMVERAGQATELLRLDDRMVFSDMDGNLWFVYLPASTARRRGGKSPLVAFLGNLAKSGKVALASSDDMLLSRRLRKLIGTEGFSVSAYQDFLVSEYGVRLDFSDTAAPQGQQPQRARRTGLPGEREDVVQTSVDLIRATPPRTVVRRPAPEPGEERTTTFRLVALDGSEGNYLLGDCASVVVGRGSACDVRIPNNLRISRRHARIERAGKDFRVTDLGSANGTFVRGRELHEGEWGEVALGETFELADVPFCVRRA